MAEIQERYARLVLNVKKPEPPPVEETTRTKEKTEEKVKEDKPKIDRKKESVAKRSK